MSARDIIAAQIMLSSASELLFIKTMLLIMILMKKSCEIIMIMIMIPRHSNKAGITCKPK